MLEVIKPKPHINHI